ncbi:MAG: S1/P1 nuclease [Deltaproteobacteria bacterium]
MKKSVTVVIVIATLFLSTTLCYGWSCKTHTFIADQAGMKNPEYACIPDEVRHENYNLMIQFHYHSAAPDAIVTPEYIQRYNVRTVNVREEGKSDTISIKIPDRSGVLYWKISDLYNRMNKKGLQEYQYNYYLMSIAHFIGDLSQPLHNYPYKQQPAADGKIYESHGIWSADKHSEFDSALDAAYPLSKEDTDYLLKKINTINIKNSDDMSREVANIANSSIALANTCFKEKRGMSRREALDRVAMSVSLLKAVLK